MYVKSFAGMESVRLIKWIALVGLLGLIGMVATPLEIEGAPKKSTAVNPERAALELRTAYRNIPHARPWQTTEIERSLRPAIYLGGGAFLSFEPAMDRAVGSTLRFPGDLEISAHLLHSDRGLGLNLLRIDQQGDEARGWQEPRRTAFAEQFDFRERGVTLDLVGYDNNVGRGLRRHTVFAEGMGAGRLPEVSGHQARMLPLLQFSGWTSGIRAGDLLFARRAGRSELVGIVVRFHENDRYGFALPAPVLAGYIERTLASTSGKKSGTVAQLSESVLSDPGFRTESISSRSARAYYGLKPGSEGALLVTRVMPYLHALRDRLQAGDVIVGVNGQRLGPGGTIQDSRYGVLPLNALLGLRDGRPLKAGAVVKLDIARKRELRTVSLELHPHQPGYVRVPAYFRLPAYLITGGLVFVELSEKYLAERQAAGAANNGAPRLNFLARVRRLLDRPEKSRYVILDRVLPVQINEAYQSLIIEAGRPLLVQSLNGVAARSLSHLKTMMQENLIAGRDLAFGLEGGRLIVLPGIDHGAALKAADARVRARHGIAYLQANLDRAPK